MESFAVFVTGPEAIHRLKRRSPRRLDFARHVAGCQRATQKSGDIYKWRGRSARAAALNAHSKSIPQFAFSASGPPLAAGKRIRPLVPLTRGNGYENCSGVYRRSWIACMAQTPAGTSIALGIVWLAKSS